jgi:hypothetical protein
MNQTSHLPGFSSSAQYDLTRELLRAADYTPAGVAETLGRSRLLAIRGGDLPQYLYRTRGGSPRDTLIRLLLLEGPVAESSLHEALQGASVDSWIEAALVRREGDQVVAQVRILPYEQLYLASDLAEDIRRGARSDFVMGLGHATELLAYASVPATAGETLDMATGCGALGLLAAAAGQRVLATDINPRAIAFARFNARLNGIVALEAVAGDMFAPAAGRRFERILCNPPFVIAPQARYTFRDSGRRGDAFCREVARAVPDLLADGGYFQMLANVPHVTGRDWRADWQQWFTGLDCDAIVWTNQTSDIRDYAETWIRDTESADSPQQVQRYDQWMSYYESQQIEAVSYGVVTMRRRSGTNFVRIDDADRTITGPCGKQIEQAFRWEDFLAGLATEQDLLECRFRLAKSAEIVTTSAATQAGEMVAKGAELQLTGGVKTQSHLDPASLEVVRRCNGQTTPRQMLPELSRQFDIGQDNLAAALPQIVEQLARRGYLEPVEQA